MSDLQKISEGGRISGDPILGPLNSPQREGVTSIEGPLFVLAGAGSGKTRVITHRIAYLLRCGISAESILAITFTNKAAGEMRERVEGILGIRSPWISTFHSFAARILRRHIYRIEPYNCAFTIYDDGDTQSLIKEIIRELGFDSRQWSPRGVASTISAVKNRGVRNAGELPAKSNYRDQIIRDVFLRYQNALEERNCVDFDDLLLLLVRLFQEHPDLLERYREQFQHVLIDEYQDTNLVQYQIGSLLAEKSRNLCVTGDPDQSIYSWRGADLKNLERFEADFPEARFITLDQNYRSTMRILRAANAVIRNNPQRKPKDLWSEKPEGDPVRIRRFLDGADEARGIARTIRELQDQGIRGGDIAIFYRINALSREIERAFRFAVIPYVLVGGVEFYQRAEVKDLIAYLRILANPRDTESLRRIINVPPRRIGDATIQRAAGYARDKNIPLLDVILKEKHRAGFRGTSRQALEGFAKLYGELESYPSIPVARLIEKVIQRTGYINHLRDSRGEEAENRIRNVEELVNAAAQFDSSRAEGNLEGFLGEVALLSSVDRWERREDRVPLMTLHSAKGLEFPVVFIIGFESGLLPLVRSTPDPDENDRPDLSEERRLLYVGITRAQEKLFITHTCERMRFGRTVPSTSSQFLEELVDDQSRPGIDLDASTQACLESEDEEEGFTIQEKAGGDDYGWDDLMDEDPFPRGARVLHKVFGKGTVVRTWGVGSRRRVTIRFDKAGEKQLAVGIAKLERLR